MDMLNDLTFVQFTDLHLGEGNGSIVTFAKMIDEINALDPQPRFVVHTGDICLQTIGMASQYFRLSSRFEMPVYHTLGNHDVMVREPDPISRWKELTGRPNFYRFDVEGVRFLVLDGHKVHPERNGWDNVVGEVGREEWEWLEWELRDSCAGSVTIAFIHIPLLSTYPQRRGRAPGEADAWEVSNGQEVADLLADARVKAVFAGHFHENETILYRGVPFVCTGSVCGAWWDWETWPHNPDGSPKGYRIVSVSHQTGEVSALYKGIGRSMDDQIAIYLQHRSREVEIIANVFDGDGRWQVQWRPDGGAWSAMQYLPASSTDSDFLPAKSDAIPHCCAHLWRAIADRELIDTIGGEIHVRTLPPPRTSSPRPPTLATASLTKSAPSGHRM